MDNALDAINAFKGTFEGMIKEIDDIKEAMEALKNDKKELELRVEETEMRNKELEVRLERIEGNSNSVVSIPFNLMNLSSYAQATHAPRPSFGGGYGRVPKTFTDVPIVSEKVIEELCQEFNIPRAFGMNSARFNPKFAEVLCNYLFDEDGNPIKGGVCPRSSPKTCWFAHTYEEQERCNKYWKRS